MYVCLFMYRFQHFLFAPRFVSLSAIALLFSIHPHTFRQTTTSDPNMLAHTSSSQFTHSIWKHAIMGFSSFSGLFFHQFYSHFLPQPTILCHLISNLPFSRYFSGFHFNFICRLAYFLLQRWLYRGPSRRIACRLVGLFPVYMSWQAHVSRISNGMLEI